MICYIKTAVTGLVLRVKHASFKFVNSLVSYSTPYPQIDATIMSMGLRFDEKKAAESAALILSLRGGQMHYMKLIKLLYLVDREALSRWGIPVTTDTYVSMDHGPVVSAIYNLIRRVTKPTAWAEYISAPMGDCNKEVSLLSGSHLKLEKLSRAEEKLIREVYEKYGRWNRYKLRDHVMHALAEWKDPEGSAIPISIADILSAQGEDPQEIIAIKRELRRARSSDDMFSALA
jgi:uncharacterized phage-associated protein